MYTKTVYKKKVPFNLTADYTSFGMEIVVSIRSAIIKNEDILAGLYFSKAEDTFEKAYHNPCLTDEIEDTYLMLMDSIDGDLSVIVDRLVSLNQKEADHVFENYGFLKQ